MSPPPCAILLSGVLNTKKIIGQINRRDAIPLCERGVEQAALGRVRHAVDENIDLPKVLLDLIEHRADLRRLVHIRSKKNAAVLERFATGIMQPG